MIHATTQSAHQNQGRVVETIARIDVYALNDLLLADLQVSSPACFTKYSEALADVKGIFFFQSAGIYLLSFDVERLFNLMLSHDHTMG